MKATVFLCLSLFLTSARSQVIHENYDSYYSTLPSVFSKPASLTLLSGRNGIVFWRNRRIRLENAITFPGEFAKNENLATNIQTFEKFPYACIHGMSPTASGKAVRHRSVYLLDATDYPKIVSYKLPSLFASCVGVHLDRGNKPLFFNAQYSYSRKDEEPTGTILEEYMLSKGKFERTGKSVFARYVEFDNVWKIEVDSSPVDVN